MFYKFDSILIDTTNIKTICDLLIKDKLIIDKDKFDFINNDKNELKLNEFNKGNLINLITNKKMLYNKEKNKETETETDKSKEIETDKGKETEIVNEIDTEIDKDKKTETYKEIDLTNMNYNFKIIIEIIKYCYNVLNNISQIPFCKYNDQIKNYGYYTKDTDKIIKRNDKVNKCYEFITDMLNYINCLIFYNYIFITKN